MKVQDCNLSHLIPWRTSELLGLFGSNSRRHIRLLDLNVTLELISLESTHVSLGKGDGVLDPVPELDVVEVVQDVAEVKLHALVHHHAQDTFAMLVFAIFEKELK